MKNKYKLLVSRIGLISLAINPFVTPFWMDNGKEYSDNWIICFAVEVLVIILFILVVIAWNELNDVYDE